MSYYGKKKKKKSTTLLNPLTFQNIKLNDSIALAHAVRWSYSWYHTADVVETVNMDTSHNTAAIAWFPTILSYWIILKQTNNLKIYTGTLHY